MMNRLVRELLVVATVAVLVVLANPEDEKCSSGFVDCTLLKINDQSAEHLALSGIDYFMRDQNLSKWNSFFKSMKFSKLIEKEQKLVKRFCEPHVEFDEEFYTNVAKLHVLTEMIKFQENVFEAEQCKEFNMELQLEKLFLRFNSKVENLTRADIYLHFFVVFVTVMSRSDLLVQRLNSAYFSKENKTKKNNLHKAIAYFQNRNPEAEIDNNCLITLSVFHFTMEDILASISEQHNIEKLEMPLIEINANKFARGALNLVKYKFTSNEKWWEFLRNESFEDNGDKNARMLIKENADGSKEEIELHPDVPLLQLTIKLLQLVNRNLNNTSLNELDPIQFCKDWRSPSKLKDLLPNDTAAEDSQIYQQSDILFSLLAKLIVNLADSPTLCIAFAELENDEEEKMVRTIIYFQGEEINEVAHNFKISDCNSLQTFSAFFKLIENTIEKINKDAVYGKGDNIEIGDAAIVGKNATENKQ